MSEYQVEPEQSEPTQWQRNPPAEYLSDEKGLYGIRINHPKRPMTVCLRPDKLAVPSYHQASWLHALPRKTKEASLEDSMVRQLTNAIYATKYPKFVDVQRPRELSKEDRKKYFAVPWYSRRIINGMWKRVIKEAADPEALKLARRFHMSLRLTVYCAAATSLRAKQFIETFPLLGAYIYNEYHRQMAHCEKIESGMKLKEIAKLADVPMALRKIKPGAVHALTPIKTQWRFYNEHSELVHSFLPEQTLRQYRWLMLLHNSDADNGFKRWLAKNAPTNLKLADLMNDARDLRDWFGAAAIQPNVENGAMQYPTCSWDVAKERSAEWHRTAHERYARQNALLDEQHRAEMAKPFPEPWIPGRTSAELCEMNFIPLTSGIEIVPLTTAQMLEDEGTRMHHCVSGYAHYVKRGDSYIYSVRENGKSLATLELGKNGPPQNVYEYQAPVHFDLRTIAEATPLDMKVTSRVIFDYGVRQLRGPCNAEVHHSIKVVVNRWLEEGNRKCRENYLTQSSLQQLASDVDCSSGPLLAPMLPHPLLG